MLPENIKQIIDKEINSYCWKDKDGQYYIEIYVDYRDELGEDNIKKILECDTKEQAQEMFNQIMWDMYEDYECDLYQELLKKIESTFKNEVSDSENIYYDYEDEIRDYINDQVYIKYPYDHYLNENVCLNVVVDVGDGNYDFTKNELFGCNYTEKGLKEPSSLVWLMQQQGYTMEQIEKFIEDEDFQGSKFLESVYNECLNTSTCMNALTFFIKTTLKEAIELKGELKDITIPKHINCGLVDFWNGAGSLLEIELEKDVIIPKEYIDSITIDGGRGRWGVGEIYGMMSSFWKEIA